MKVSAIWTSQPIDAAVQAEWAECLARVSFGAAVEAVRHLRDSGRREAPTPGEIYQMAAGIDRRAEEERRRRVLRLADRTEPSEQERDRRRAVFRELMANLDKRAATGVSGMGSGTGGGSASIGGGAGNEIIKR